MIRTLTAAFQTSVHALMANKLRAFLTVIGIVAGVGAVIASLSIGSGVRANVTQQVQGQFVNFELVGQVLLGLPSTSKLI